MNSARNNVACRKGARKSSATALGSTTLSAVNSPNVVPRNVKTSGALLIRSTINVPPARSTSTNGQLRSGRAPHQLWPVPNSGTDSNNASPAGLNTCHRLPANRYLESVASTPTAAVTGNAVNGSSTNPTIRPESSADDGQVSGRP